MKAFIKIQFLSLLLFLSVPAMAKLPFTFRQLALKDLDQMNDLIETRKKEAIKDKITLPLREAMVIILSRPDDHDKMINKIMPVLKNELDKYELYEATFESVVDEAIKALKENPSPKKNEVELITELSTYVVILENALSEMRPTKAENFSKRVIAKVQDAKIELSRYVRSQLVMGPMKEVKSPSKTAKGLLETK